MLGAGPHRANCCRAHERRTTHVPDPPRSGSLEQQVATPTRPRHNHTFSKTPPAPSRRADPSRDIHATFTPSRIRIRRPPPAPTRRADPRRCRRACRRPAHGAPWPAYRPVPKCGRPPQACEIKSRARVGGEGEG
eukprot:scaffold27229_cov146-Isochrysis_galbana.AAC.1